MKYNILYTLLVWCMGLIQMAWGQETELSGRVTNAENQPIIGASIALEGSPYGGISDENGRFVIREKIEGEYTLVASYLGYTTYRQGIKVNVGDKYKFAIKLESAAITIDGITVSGKTELREVREKAYNVTVIDALQLHNTTLDVGHALDRISGIRVRESGGVGSQMNISLNGFRGKQVRFLIDGIPMDNFGSAFQMNNIPIHLAERIEVYKGVVPIGLGADALGGAINIITRAQKRNELEASYSFGSFNTHRFNIYGVFTGENGLIAKVNAFANYSDNDYKVAVDAADINTGAYFPKQNLRRFHDQYHNQTLIASIGVRDVSYADHLSAEMTVGSSYKEIQTGARIVTVFGAWHRRGTIIKPALKYQKKDLGIENLDLTLNAHYNFGSEQNIDTLNRRYNWLGQYKEYENDGGERSYSTYKYRNNNGLAMANLTYRLNDGSSLVLSNTFNSFNRQGSDALFPDNDAYDRPKKNLKNISGLGYNLKFEEWDGSIFMKNYNQQNYFSQSYNPTGIYGDVAYVNAHNSTNLLGYGLAVSHFFNSNFQIKTSYEKSYRMPETEELFGDLINLRGNLSLRPEHSHNINLGADFWWNIKDAEKLHISSNLFYRNAKDFIRPRLDNNQTMQIMDNLGKVINMGIETEVRYHLNKSFNIGGNLTYQDLRNNVQYEEGQTVESVVYRDRIPNMPFLYGNADASYTFDNLWNKGHKLTLGYNGLYVHGFYLYWPSLGNDKLDIPDQISHDVTLTYSLGRKMQFVVETRNLMDSKLYDNFSLQKPGRSLTGKIKYTFL
ncbi:TonB-dependent receptor [Membranihabitans marinus]|uniref:TonB-dependent receptor n=1 Tax=Membranihabitans marinus TaxID=1227546 RepID=UPI001F1C66F8|nr:TonB-dependent receptor [Membranihabitans marinus]